MSLSTVRVSLDVVIAKHRHSQDAGTTRTLGSRKYVEATVSYEQKAAVMKPLRSDPTLPSSLILLIYVLSISITRPEPGAARYLMPDNYSL